MSMPGKIRATAARGAKTFHIPDNLDGDQERHAWAARELCRQFDAQDGEKYGTHGTSAWAKPFVTGCLPDGTWAHVFPV
jgi:hypothetical protein